MNVFRKSKDLVMRVIESAPRTLSTFSSATKGLCFLGLAAASISLAAPAVHADSWDNFQQARRTAQSEEVTPAETRDVAAPYAARQPSLKTPTEQFNEAVVQGQRYISPYQFFITSRFAKSGSNYLSLGSRDFDPREDNLTWSLQGNRAENVSETRHSTTTGDAQHELSGSAFKRGFNLGKHVELSPRGAFALGDHRKMGELGGQFDLVNGVYRPRLGFWKRWESSEQDATVRANGMNVKTSTDLDNIDGFGLNAGFDLPTRLAQFAFDGGYFNNDINGTMGVSGPRFTNTRAIDLETSARYGRATANLGQLSLSYLNLASQTRSPTGSDGVHRHNLIIAAPKIMEINPEYHLGIITRGNLDTQSNRGFEGRLILSHPIVAELRARELAAGDDNTTEAIDARELLEALRQRGIFTLEMLGGLDRNLETDLHGQHYGLELNRRWGRDDGMNRLGLGWQQSVSDFGSGSRSGRDTVYGVLGFANGYDLRVDYARDVVRGERDNHSIGFNIAIPFGGKKDVQKND